MERLSAIRNAKSAALTDNVKGPRPYPRRALSQVFPHGVRKTFPETQLAVKARNSLASIRVAELTRVWLRDDFPKVEANAHEFGYAGPTGRLFHPSSLKENQKILRPYLHRREPGDEVAATRESAGAH